MFFDNYVRLCNAIGKSPSFVANELGITSPTVTRWKGGSEPRYATLAKIADYFGVTIEALPAETAPDIAKAADPEANGLSEYDIKALEWFHSLSPENRRAILTVTGGPAELADAPDRE